MLTVERHFIGVLGVLLRDLDDFEESLRRVRDEEADFYVTFHHKGVIEGREEFLRLVDSFAAVTDAPARSLTIAPSFALDSAGELRRMWRRPTHARELRWIHSARS